MIGFSVLSLDEQAAEGCVHPLDQVRNMLWAHPVNQKVNG